VGWMEPNQCRVLSIQSWVCHGYVGNRCSVFALQTLGIEVDAINTVHFSNNTGYPSFAGQVLSGDDLWAIFEGLVKNDLAYYTHLLTGYNKTASSLRVIIKIRDKLREINPNLIHVCDPVMGDDGKLYVGADLVSIYRDEVISGADVILPNQTECEFLTGVKINSEADALVAIDKLHELMRNPSSVVIITSSYFEGPDSIGVYGSTKNTEKNTHKIFKFNVPKLSPLGMVTYTGTGDLFASLLVGWSIITKDYVEATEKVIASLGAVLKRTHAERLKGGKGEAGQPRRGVELQLIQSRKDFENPTVELKAQIIFQSGFS